ncbi:kita-kyushu lung cancer antigen 1 [Balaenoptera ricei]|uniref:kita-kyushu lung cancer antigen 1 n=1 Tax=Balaenoptera ricei TaxID=2746895 RepID=UPI0028BEFC41|nr:kita-kyushu lung cancer antigen 1 [Balaenoptera ricei]
MSLKERRHVLLTSSTSLVTEQFSNNLDHEVEDRNTGEMSSNSTSPALVRSSSSTQSTKSNTDKCLSVNSQWDINLQNSIAMQRKLFVNLSIMEYNLA